MAMIIVDGVAIPCPSVYEWGLNDISAAESGRTDDTLMWKNRVGQKRKLHLQWNGTDKQTTATILQAFNPEYVQVTYEDSMSGSLETRTFYIGDRSAVVKIWTTGNKWYSSISFDIIER